MTVATGTVNEKTVIIDIRREELDQSLLELMLQSLNANDTDTRHLPTLLLYDETGLKLFEEIIYLEEYYPTNAEIEALNNHANRIASRIRNGTRLVELGSGSLRKVNILLRAFETARKKVDYYALDLSLSELQRTLSAIPAGTYHNFNPLEAAEFLHNVSQALGPQDLLLVGIDSCMDFEKIFTAYNDPKGVTKAFYRQGLNHANRLLGYDAFQQNEWKIVGRYDEDLQRHKASYVALANVNVNGLRIAKGDELHLEMSYKYSNTRLKELWQKSGLLHQAAYSNEQGDYNIHVLSPAVVTFPSKPEEYAASPVPSLKDWHELWATWDIVTREMTPEDELSSKPIKLRNDLIFYLGHIPAFCDIQVAKATGVKNTDPAAYATIFERGIDPNVDRPDMCHDHSQAPDVWPLLEDILQYQGQVRDRITGLTASGTATSDPMIGRSLWLSFEHEAMHLETYLYMLLQSPKTKPPPPKPVPNFAEMDESAEMAVVPNSWFKISTRKLDIGLHDSESNLNPDSYFGWDNEKPHREVLVGEFEAQARPISNGEYTKYLIETSATSIPASWNRVEQDAKKPKSTDGVGRHHTPHEGLTNGDDEDRSICSEQKFLEGIAVRTFYGPVPLRHARHWPVMASFDELAGYARWSGGRIPTMEEARSIYAQVQLAKANVLEKVPSSLIPAVNGHLSDNGVKEKPPPYQDLAQSSPAPSVEQTPNPRSTFIDLDDLSHNVAFNNWTPTPVTPHYNQLYDQNDFGGVWEWTSFVLVKWNGFEAMPSYPGYTADFFDSKHNIILGGSWATHPRIAGRKTFVNWYQRNYPYTWAGARLVRDVSSGSA